MEIRKNRPLAVISVSDKAGLEPFARGLIEQGVGILSTGGTASFLEAKGIQVTSVSEYTGSPEVLEGRVKSLHPRIHAGILARRDRDDDLAELASSDISQIDYVIVNLYPFPEKVAEIEAKGDTEHESLVEYIDIGGPTMLRAAAKNCKDVVPVSSPEDYPGILEELKQNGQVSLELRRELAAKVFALMSAYDGAVARYFSLGEQLIEESGKTKQFAPFESLVLKKKANLRYGENPHQAAGLYSPVNLTAAKSEKAWEQLQGKKLSYNNLVDMQASIELLLEFYADLDNQQIAVAIKHTNPCGVAIRESNLEAFMAAKECDPVSIFGGIIAVSGCVDEKLAEKILEQFVEIVVVEELSDAARERFSKKKNLRLIRCDYSRSAETSKKDRVLIKNISGEYLLQTSDENLAKVSSSGIVSEEKGDELILRDLQFAWGVSKHVKSNAIVIAKNCQAIGVGAGQMSRVDAAKIAIQRANEHGRDLKDSVAASDAFLPFPDALEVLNDAGVKALVQPGGSIKDEEVISEANKRKVVMVMTGERHFRH